MENEKKEEKKVVDITMFFSRKNEVEGVWFEPTFDGMGIGIEFRVIGINSGDAAVSSSAYVKELDRIETIKDEKKRNDETIEAIARHVADLVKDVRAKEGYEAKEGTEPLKYTKEGIYLIMCEATEIAKQILSFAHNGKGFMQKNQH